MTNTLRKIFLGLVVITSVLLSCKKDRLIPSTNLSVRDPSLINFRGRYYLFGTGAGISTWSSADLKNWEPGPNVFSVMPGWIYQQFPNFDGSIWAPDITYKKGQYWLLYSVSQYGTTNSAIGLATNTTLNPTDSLYHWVDRGRIISSAGASFNAIDPNEFTDSSSKSYLVLGSFFDGIKIVEFRDSAILQSQMPLPTVAARHDGVNAIEAPFLIKRNGYFYLFASIGTCCEGVKSTYQTIVGRSLTVDGDYVDRNGGSMKKGGGEVVLSGNELWHGAGGGSVINMNGQYIMVFFSYDATGVERLRIADIVWSADDWPSAVEQD